MGGIGGEGAEDRAENGVGKVAVRPFIQRREGRPEDARQDVFRVGAGRVEEVAEVGVNDRGSDSSGGASGNGSPEDGKEGVEREAEASAEDIVTAVGGVGSEGVGGGEFEGVDRSDVVGVGVG